MSEDDFKKLLADGCEVCRQIRKNLDDRVNERISIEVTDNSEPTVYYSFKVDPYESDKISSYGYAYWNPNN